MFDYVAKHKRVLQIILGLTIVPFAFFGLESYTGGIGRGGDVANVNGSPISQREFVEEMSQQQARLRAVIGSDVDVGELLTPEMRQGILESMIAQRLVVSEVLDSRLAMAREEVVASIVAAPEFQEGGKFSSERYLAYLRSRNLSDEANVAQLRLDIPAARIAGAVAATAFRPRAVALQLIALENQKREIAEALIPAERYLPQVKLDEARIKAYYDANTAEFSVPERVRAEYIVLSAADMAKGESVSDAELKAAYEARASQFGASEQRRASHILVASKEEAEKLTAEAKKAPQGFGELAKKHSQDTGSAENGGDLGFVSKDGLASKKLEQAVFAMKPGEVAGPVESEFGFHVIHLAAIQPGKAKSFDEVKQELATEIARQKAQKKFSESADGLNNLVYEQSDSLKPAAERYKLKLETSGWIAKQPAPELGVLAHPKLMNALFSADSIKQRRNTDAVEVAQGMLVAARVAEHQPASQRPFAEVKAEVERTLARREAVALAQKEGSARLAALARGGATEGLPWSAAKTVSRREPQGLPAAALRRIMATDAAKLPAYTGIERGEQGYVIYRISKLIASDATDAKQNAEELARVDRQAGAEQLDAYVASLRARAKVEINRANLEKK